MALLRATFYGKRDELVSFAHLRHADAISTL